MTLAFIPVIINKCLRNINFQFTFTSLHRLCVLHYCQDHIFVLKGKNLHCLSRKCFLQCLQSRLSWSYGYWNHPLELTIYNVNVNARCIRAYPSFASKSVLVGELPDCVYHSEESGQIPESDDGKEENTKLQCFR